MSSKHEQIAIFGQYKTGTTALFYRILDALPDDTRTYYEPQRCRPRPRPDESALAKVILALYEGPAAVEYDGFLAFPKRILLLRDPRDRIVSGTLFIVQQSQRIWEDSAAVDRVVDLLRRKEQDPHAVPLVEILGEILSLAGGGSVDRLIEELDEHHRWIFDFQQRMGDRLELKYESFVDGDIAELERFLGFPLRSEARVDSANSHVARTRKHGDWKNWFIAEDTERFRDVCNTYLNHFGYPLDWETNEAPEIPAAHASEYVLRTVAKRRSERT